MAWIDPVCRAATLIKLLDQPSLESLVCSLQVVLDVFRFGGFQSELFKLILSRWCFYNHRIIQTQRHRAKRWMRVLEQPPGHHFRFALKNRLQFGARQPIEYKIAIRSINPTRKQRKYTKPLCQECHSGDTLHEPSQGLRDIEFWGFADIAELHTILTARRSTGVNKFHSLKLLFIARRPYCLDSGNRFPLKSLQLSIGSGPFHVSPMLINAPGSLNPCETSSVCRDDTPNPSASYATEILEDRRINLLSAICDPANLR